MLNIQTHEDYNAVLNFVLKVCNRALSESQPMTPAALTGYYNSASKNFERLGIFDLQRMQRESNEKTAEFVRDLSQSGRYGFVAYVTKAWVVEHNQVNNDTINLPTGLIAEHPNGVEALVTIIYTAEGQAFAHHLIDEDNQRLIPGELEYLDTTQTPNVQLKNSALLATLH